MLRPVLFLSAFTSLATCQSSSFEGYKTVDNFTCDASSETSKELVNRTSKTGTVQSPCYGHSTNRYPEEQVSGQKLILIKYDNSSVIGYRLTFRAFQIAKSDRLYIGNDTVPFSTNRRAVRLWTLFSNSTDGLVYLKEGQDGAINKVLSVDSNNAVDLKYQQVYLDFYTVEDSERGKGFQIDYVADVDRCKFSGEHIFCKHGGVCSRLGFNEASCNCAGTGYKGANCNVDIDECDSSDLNNCDNVSRANCTNTFGSFSCTCKKGYSGDGTSCENVNECDFGTHTCDSNAECTDNAGSFTCTCKTGFTGDGLTCKDINECEISSLNNCGNVSRANCTNTIGSFGCTCKEGYSGNGTLCENIDECMDGSHTCNTNANCVDNDGSFTCVCKAGFTGDGLACEDVNECDEGTHNCSEHASCSNIKGSFTCSDTLSVTIAAPRSGKILKEETAKIIATVD